MKCGWFTVLRFRCTAEWFTYSYTCILFQILFPSRLLRNAEQSSLCYTVDPCWLSILNIAVCRCQSQTPDLSLTHLPPTTTSSWNSSFFFLIKVWQNFLNLILTFILRDLSYHIWWDLCCLKQRTPFKKVNRLLHPSIKIRILWLKEISIWWPLR